MGVNMAGYCIENDEICQEASRQEIIRRYLKSLVKRRQGKNNDSEINKIDSLMKMNGIDVSERKCIQAAHAASLKNGVPSAAIELEDGTIITGKNTPLLRCNSAMIINALKHLAGIKDSVLLLPKAILEPICKLKTESLGGHNPKLHLDEVLMALAISALTNPLAEMAMAQLPNLKGCQSHSTVILSEMDNGTLRKLGIDHTSDPIYETKKLFHHNH